MSATDPQPGDGQTGPLDDLRIAPYQLLIIALAVLLAVLDGFDAFSMAFVAPVVARDWALRSAVLGVLLSSGFAGMAIGSITISPLADLFGRKPVILGSLLLMTGGAFLSGLAHSVAPLVLSRVITGLGLGAMVTLSTALGAEFANRRYRAFIVSTASQGFAIGNLVGGLATAALLKSWGWRSVFWSGGMAGVVLVMLIGVLLPESPAYLIARRGPDALPRLNRVLARLRQPPLAALPVAPPPRRSSYRALFVPGAARVTIVLMLVDVLLMMASFYLLSWLPQFITSSGFSPASAALVGAVTASSGLVGGLLFGWLATIVRPMLVAGLCLAALGASLLALAAVPGDLPLLTACAACFGFFLSPSMGVLFAIMTQAFPPLARASGMGLVVGAGRIAGAAGPALAGALFAAGGSRFTVTALFAAGPIIAAAVLIQLMLRSPAAEN